MEHLFNENNLGRYRRAMPQGLGRIGAKMAAPGLWDRPGPTAT